MNSGVEDALESYFDAREVHEAVKGCENLSAETKRYFADQFAVAAGLVDHAVLVAEGKLVSNLPENVVEAFPVEEAPKSSKGAKGHN